MITKSSMKVARTGFAVVETVDLRFELTEEDREEFRKHPERVFRRLLEEAGEVVNSVRVLKKPHSAIGELAEKGSYHFVYPPSDRSIWMCCCSD